MQTVRFGRTGLKVSRFCLGTMSMGSSKWKGWVLDEDKTAPILKSALDLGINFFDMADWYSNGANEEVVGRTLLKLKQRDSLVLATKAFYAMSEDANDQGSSRKHLMASIDRSLRRIGTDYIDLYLLHAFDPHTPLAETMEALHDIVKSGKARYIGACTMYSWQFAEMNAIARQNNWTEFVNMQCQYSLLYREEEREMMPYCQDKGIAVSTFSPLARGYLTGVQKSARTEHDPFLTQFFGDEIDVEIANRVVKVAADRAVQPGQIAMAWVAQNGNSTVPIIGADSPEQLQLAVAAGEIVLSVEERQFLEQAYRPRDMINDYNEIRRPRSFKS
ncbi:aryl-alcohol dehydrogenase-like predicted oxidoreductase [Collimonas sp. PA-H2]|uniref:aldo/keto reductase n=1 Tax=Collimonas sp. PA-H2 TaxID=1881062 RepID=UPI000BF7F1B3|nr:aldo/keto reductase [Collimonas sp. PA-H2]PFH11223.1 aryl-alcohol dehydrogenase-like predicted oxidoreductase [Collimonas sp. PA-H2]